MPTPKEFVNQAIEMETFFEDEEPTYDEFMRYPPFDSLMGEEFTLQNMIKSYREGRIVFVVKYGKVYANNGASFQMSYRCNFLTKEYPNTLFQIERLGNFNFDELNPTTLEDTTHEALMDVAIEEEALNLSAIHRQTMAKFSGLTLEQESALSKVLSMMLFESVSKALSEDGTQSLILKYNPNDFKFYTSPYLKIYQPVNMKFPSWLEKALSKLFDEAKV